MAWYQKASDDFNGSDSNPIGGNWSTMPNFYATARTSNMLQHGTASQWCRSYNNAYTPIDDQYSQGTIISNVAVLAAHYAWIGARLKITAGNTYGYEANAGLGTGDPYYKLYKVVNGVGTQLGSNYSKPYHNDVFRLTCDGTTITLFQNGASVISQSDSAIASGYVGAGIYNFSDGNLVSIDDWSAGDDVAPPVSIPIFYSQFRRRWGA